MSKLTNRGGNDTPTPTTYISGVTQDPHLIEGNKTFVFNQTGNIMVSTTQDPSDPLDENIRAVFNEVSVFFAAMTKAITTSYRVKDNEKIPYTLFDFEAIERVISGSGCFMQVSKEVVKHTSNSYGADFSKDLIASLLALPGSGAMAFAASMVAGIGQEGLELAADTSTASSKVGSLIFICEYLMGMPIVTATALYIDAAQASKVFQAGPCLKTKSCTTEMTLYKDIYYFVTPTFIHRYAGDLDSIISDDDYGEFIAYLRTLVQQMGYISAIVDKDSNPCSSLKPDETYTIKGEGFGNGGSLQLAKDGSSATVPLTSGEWKETSIIFKVNADAAEGGYTLQVLDTDKKVMATFPVSIEK